MSGTESEVVGTSSAISSMNMEYVRKTDRPRLTFSFEVAGSQKVNKVKTLSIRHGTMTLNAK